MSIPNPSSTLLALDSALGCCSAALMQGGGVVAARFEPEGTKAAERLVPMIESLLAESALDYAALEGVIVTVGPGSFTGLRIALCVAQAIGFARNIPVFGISTLTSMAIAARPLMEAGETLLVAHKAGKGQYYAQHFRFEHGVRAEDEIRIVSPQDSVVSDSTAIVGSAAEDAAFAECRDIGLRMPDAASFGMISGVDSALILPGAPLYIRAADAIAAKPFLIS